MMILVLEKDPSELQKLSGWLHKSGHTVVVAEGFQSALQAVHRERPELVLFSLNGQLSQAIHYFEASQSWESPPPVIVISQKASLEEAVAMMKQGAHDFWTRPVSEERLIKTVEWLQARSRVPAGESAPSLPLSIITQNPAMLQLKAIAKRVAASSATVFLQGESGTGKELFARYLHSQSMRRQKPFIAINCAALPENLMESELFGHEKGAFTGAIRTKEGKFELAHTGTLFLDEVTEIPVHLQAKLLRVLQEGEVDRVGGKHPVPVDVRVIASTNLVIEDALKDARFRRDLYYRLNVIPLRIPPLRGRPEDMALLCHHFLKKYNGIHGCTVERISSEALRALQAYPWPGNVRELENVIQRAILLCQGREVSPENLIFDGESHTQVESELELMPINEMEKRLIQKALTNCNGNRTRAAEILGISVRTLRNKLHEYRAMEDPLP